MKQAILHFHSGDYLLTELPAGAYGVGQTHVFHGEDPITYHIEGNGDKSFAFKFPGFVELIGKLSEVTEKQFQQIVDSWQRYFPEQHFVYRNYNLPVFRHHLKLMEQNWDEPFGKATESFYSKMEAEGLYTNNPHGEKPADDDYSFFTDTNLSLKEAWELAERKTFHPDRSFLFRILNQQQ